MRARTRMGMGMREGKSMVYEWYKFAIEDDNDFVATYLSFCSLSIRFGMFLFIVSPRVRCEEWYAGYLELSQRMSS